MSDELMDGVTRRKFLTVTGQSLITASLVGGLAATANAQIPPLVPLPARLSPVQAPIPLPPTSAPTEQNPGPPPEPLPMGQKIGFAVVGLGNLALQQILPGFAQSKFCKVAALVSGDRAKALQVAAQHGVAEQSVYSYADFDKIADNPDVQVVYVVLPNALHEEYVVRAAKAGKHVLCEKPMATSPAECERMIAACKAAARHLMVAYRIQYEPNNYRIKALSRSGGEFGRVKMIEGFNGQNQGDPNQWRQKLSLAGGGSLPDVGLYCLNTFRYLTGEEPLEVTGHTYSTPGDPRFKDVEELCYWSMRFPSGVVANAASSYGSHESRRYRVLAESGWFGLDPAFSYGGLQQEQSYAKGPVEYRMTPKIEAKQQFALEMDHMAECVKLGKTPYTPGEEGLQDHRIMAAIYESAASGRPVALPRIETIDTFRGSEPSREG